MSFPVKNTFTTGIVDTDTALQYVKPDALIKANNIDVVQQGDNGVAKSIRGNVLVGGPINDGDYCVGETTWGNDVFLLYTTQSEYKNYWRQYDTILGVWTTVVQADMGVPVDLAPTGVLRLSADIVGGDFLYWTLSQKNSDGSLTGIGEPKRLHLVDAISAPTTYSDFSCNLAKPNKLNVAGAVDPDVADNQLKHNSFIFYRRYTNKYNEQTVLSYPSNNIDVSRGVDLDLLYNRININGFTVADDITSVDILMSNDSTATFKIISTIDTTISKVVGDIAFFNDYDYPVLDAYASENIANEFPLTATEQELVDNRIVYGDVDIYRNYDDADGNKLDKNIPFNYTTEGVGTGGNIMFDGRVVMATADLDVDAEFINGSTYNIKFSLQWFIGIGESAETSNEEVSFTYIHFTGNDYIERFNEELATIPDAYLSVATGGTGSGVDSFILSYTGVGYDDGWIKAQILEDVYDANGLNVDFRYKGGIVWLDNNGRSAGVSNVTEISPDSSIEDYIFSVTTNISSSGITPPHWATKYMMVRDKVNTDLSYSIAYHRGVSSTYSDVTIYQIDTDFYTDYLRDQFLVSQRDDAATSNVDYVTSVFAKGGTVTVYSKGYDRSVNLYIMTDEDKNIENESRTTASQVLLSMDEVYATASGDNLLPPDYDVILFVPNKEVDSTAEVFSETSDVFTVSKGIDDTYSFSGDGKILRWYDTRVIMYTRVRFYSWLPSFDAIPIPIMKTDTLTLRDINHLGRGAYQVSKDVDMKYYATMVHSQHYSPSTNYNGLNSFSSKFVNFKDLELKYGRIIKLFYDDTNLIVGQESKWSKLLINKALLSSATGQSSVEKSTNFFGDIVPYNGDYGITEKHSFVANGFRRYGVDKPGGSVIRLSNDGITVINNSRSKELVDIFRDLSPGADVVCGFDSHKDEYIFAIPEVSRIFRFSEVISDHVGEYVWSDVPSHIISINSDTYIINSADSKLYEHNVGTDGKVFGEAVEHVTEYVVNLEPDKEKQYESMSIQCDIPMDIIIKTQENSTDIDNTEMLRREDSYYADIPKSTEDADSAIFGVGTVKSIDPGVSVDLYSDATNVRVGDKLFTGDIEIGTISDYDGQRIYLSGTTGLFVGNLCYTKRIQKIEGKSLKGNYATVELTNSSGESFTLKGSNMQLNLSSRV